MCNDNSQRKNIGASKMRIELLCNYLYIFFHYCDSLFYTFLYCSLLYFGYFSFVSSFYLSISMQTIAIAIVVALSSSFFLYFSAIALRARRSENYSYRAMQNRHYEPMLKSERKCYCKIERKVKYR